MSLANVAFGARPREDYQSSLVSGLESIDNGTPEFLCHIFTERYLASGTASRARILSHISRIRDTLKTSAPAAPLVGRVVLVGASGDFGGSAGEFEVAVSPLGHADEFVGASLPQTAFEFVDVSLHGQAGVFSASPFVTGVVVESANASQLTAALVFDSSGSMASNDPGTDGRRKAGNSFLDSLSPLDEVAILEFGGQVRLLEDFTSDHSRLRASFDNLGASGGTPLYEAVLDALVRLGARLGIGGVVVVLTDGASTGTASANEAVTRALAQQTPVYAVGLGAGLDFGELRGLSSATGGTFVEATNSQALEQTFAGIATGIKLGRVTVFGRATYENVPPGTYTVRGSIRTHDPGLTIPPDTDFEFTVEVQ